MPALFKLPPLLIMWVSEDYMPRLIQGSFFGSFFQFPIVHSHSTYDPYYCGGQTNKDDQFHALPPHRSLLLYVI